MTQNTCYLIIGTSRSGSSALSGAAHAMGINMGKTLLGPMANVNPKGFFEDEEIVRLHDSIYGNSFFSLENLDEEKIKKTMPLYEKAIIERCSQIKWGVKIPTMVFGVKHFASCLVDCNLKIISTQRPINHSAISMKKLIDKHPTVISEAQKLRNYKTVNTAKLASEIIGVQEVARLEALAWADTNKISNVVIDYGSLIDRPKETVERLAKFCEITDESLIRKAIKSIDPKLRHEI